ncbi:putative FAD dependent oxidoreductase, FAD/NAD(P)-binding domain superfamily [Septoria linicola]|nr:putative FAD dependent oxidoreductase, FAD/NAD(P)-binding domain superfamily [Septoria linicola]
MATPVLNATKSFWRSDLHDLDNHRTTEQLPAEVDIVVIGAGYAGASITHHLLEKSQSLQRPVSIVILEAREACSGATGRNGGHLKPDPYYRAAGALKTHGREAAEEVASFEARQVKEVQKLVDKESIDCDFVVTRATDVCMYEDARRDLEDGLDALTKANVSTASEVHYSDGRTAQGVSGVKGAKACFTYTAGHVWPYKLVLHLLKKAVDQGVNLQTHTPVKSVKPARDPRTWAVETHRGTIQTGKVIYASNAYTSSLLPEYKDKIIGVRGICSRIVATKPDAPVMSNSYILRLAPGEYDYLIPRSDGSIIVGGGRRDYFKQLGSWYDNYDDSQLIESAKHYFDGYMQRHFRGWEGSGAKTDAVWSGIMGYSSDGFPHIGEVPGKDGQYICAGFSGHGMPQIFLSAKAIASLVLEKKRVEEVDLPRLYRATQERLDSTRNVTLEGWDGTHAKVAAKL